MTNKPSGGEIAEMDKLDVLTPEDLVEFILARWKCSHGARGNVACPLNDDPDPNVFCVYHLAGLLKYGWETLRQEIQDA